MQPGLNQNVAVLFCRKNSNYKNLVSECYDIDRNARTFDLEIPVIAHPPCRAWGMLRQFAKPRPDEKDLALFAIEIIRTNGGVLEHPRGSTLFPKYLPLPGQTDSFGGFTICISQKDFGHPAEKKTFLYVCGMSKNELPRLPISFDPVLFTIDTPKGKNTLKKQCSKSWRERTPDLLMKYLIEIAEQCKKEKAGI